MFFLFIGAPSCCALRSAVITQYFLQIMFYLLSGSFPEHEKSWKSAEEHVSFGFFGARPDYSKLLHDSLVVAEADKSLPSNWRVQYCTIMYACALYIPEIARSLAPVLELQDAS
jgi:hypothetical protein